ncbi:MAG: hypothetical protein LQ349_003211 [Xanthoria aureola]|nr:MAG: hypothetical protein LQ349_003211 [Xanthoria aureola]
MPSFKSVSWQPEYSFAQVNTPASPSDMRTDEAPRDASAPPSGPNSSYASRRKTSLRPPPRDGEKVQAPEFYTITPVIHPPSRPSLLSVSPHSSIGGPSTGTAASRADSFQPAATQPQAQPVIQDTSFDHPSGYKQNPYAAELTPEQRLATEQEDQPEYDQGLPMPNCTQSRRQSTASVVIKYLPSLRRNTEDLFEGFQEWLSKNIF